MKINTIAKEVQNNLHEEMPDIYPFNYQGYNIVSANYNALYSDIETYWNQDARFREGFHVDEETKTVYIPNFFSKVNGSLKDKKKYLEFVRKLRNSSNTITIKKSICCDHHLTKIDKDFYNKNEKIFKNNDLSQNLFDYKEDESWFMPNITNVLNGRIYFYKITDSEFNFQYLTSDKKILVLKIMNKVINQNPCHFTSYSDFQIFIDLVLNMNSKFINLINNFNYGMEIPKLIVILEQMTIYDAAMFYFFNELGIDIILLSPNGRCCIEKYYDLNEISLGYFDMNFDLEKETKSEQEIKEDIEKQKKQKEKRKKEKMTDMINKLQPQWNFWAIPITIAILFTWQFSSYPGWVITLVECIGIIASIFIMLSYWTPNNYQNNNVFYVYWILIIATGMLLLYRGLDTIMKYDNQSQATTNYNSGFQIIEEEEILTENGFAIHQRLDAIITEESSNRMYCYIENDALNSNDIVFEIWIGNNIIYRSSKIPPLKYVSKIYLNENLPIGDTEIIVRYYWADKYDPHRNANDCIGEAPIIIHVVKSEATEDELYGYELE